MARVAFLFKVQEDKIEAYKEHHKNVWPEMQDALRRNGWRNYSLFLRDDGLIFGYFEPEESFEASQAGMEKEEINTRWQEFMAPFFESDDNTRPDHMMVQLEEIFHLE